MGAWVDSIVGGGGVRCGCFVGDDGWGALGEYLWNAGLAADLLIAGMYIKQWNTEKKHSKISGMNNMGFELSRLRIMKNERKHYI